MRSKVNATTTVRTPTGTERSTPVIAPRAMTIDGKVWPFLCGSYYVIATARASIPRDLHGPAYAGPAMRAGALIAAEIDRLLRDEAYLASDAAKGGE